MKRIFRISVSVLLVVLITVGNISGAFHTKHQKNHISDVGGSVDHWVGENELFSEIEEKESGLNPSFTFNLTAFGVYQEEIILDLCAFDRSNKTPGFILFRKLLI